MLQFRAHRRFNLLLAVLLALVCTGASSWVSPILRVRGSEQDPVESRETEKSLEEAVCTSRRLDFLADHHHLEVEIQEADPHGADRLSWRQPRLRFMDQLQRNGSGGPLRC